MQKIPRTLLPPDLRDPFTGCSQSDCPLFSESFPVRPRGNWNAKVLGIGEAAGLQEEKNNCTFIGPAGEELVKEANLIGLDFDLNFLMVNVCLCRPEEKIKKNKQNRQPTVEEISFCRRNLERIVKLHQPKLILLVGGIAAKNILKDKPKISDIVGRFSGPSSNNLNSNADIYTIWHPSYILRNPEKKPEWIESLIRLRDYMLGRKLLTTTIYGN